jgi:hypothetical protein
MWAAYGNALTCALLAWLASAELKMHVADMYFGNVTHPTRDDSTKDIYFTFQLTMTSTWQVVITHVIQSSLIIMFNLGKCMMVIILHNESWR